MVSIEDEKKLLILQADILDLRKDVETLEGYERGTLLDALSSIEGIILSTLRDIAWVKYKEENKFE